MSPDHRIEEIRASFDDDQEVPQETVRRWMEAVDSEVLGCLFSFLSRSRFSQRVAPPIPVVELDEFARRYLLQCINTNPQSEWTLGSYDAAWATWQWLEWLAKTGDPAGRLPLWRDALARAYKAGDARVREVLVNGTIEHIFENRSLRKLFRIWMDDPDLGAAYRDGMAWVTEGGAEHSDYPRGSKR